MDRPVRPEGLTAADPLATQRRIVLALLLLSAAVSWAILFWPRANPHAAHMAALGPTMGLTAPLFAAVWTVMMIAMMFPTAAPMVHAFHAVQARKRARGETFVATWVFVAAYVLIQAASGVVAYFGVVAAEAGARSMALTGAQTARIGGALLIVAGIYQISPWKDACLTKCRTPMSFIINSWHDGFGGAFRMGLEHGLYCLGCCWLLCAILFPLGIMNVAAMAGITLLIFAEKSFPSGERVARFAAAALVTYGAVVLFVPTILPTFVSR